MQTFDFTASRRRAFSLWPENWLTPFLPWFPGIEEASESGGAEADDAVFSRFRAAHGLLICGNQHLADQGIANAIAVLAASRHVSPAILTYGWLVIASNAIVKGDFEAVQRWTQQAVRAFQNQSPSVQKRHLQRFSGDLLALQSCAAVAGERPEVAVDLLTNALKCHRADGSTECQTLDLLLRSRCLVMMGLREEAASDLRQAKGLLNHPSGHEVSGPLSLAIENELGRLLHCRARQALVALN